MVQLKQRLHLQLSQSHHVFQFHKFRFHNGTIKIFAKYFTSEHAICRFQFHRSTIKTYKGHTSRQLDFDFNSIMVQLKQLERENIKFLLNRFQFHNGTIRTHFISGKSVCLPNFNSIMVQLKPKITLLTPTKIRDFNSIMVQLKLLFGLRFKILLRFQFHNGTIKTFKLILSLTCSTTISIP